MEIKGVICVLREPTLTEVNVYEDDLLFRPYSDGM